MVRTGRHRLAAVGVAAFFFAGTACTAHQPVHPSATSVSAARPGGSGSAPSSSPAQTSPTGTRPSTGAVASPAPGAVREPAALTAWLPPAAPGQPGYLAPGSDPSVLPGPILIADKANNRLVVVDPQGRVRWIWPQPGELPNGQTFLIPDDAFFTRDGSKIVATQEDDFVITEIDPTARTMVWRYGHPGIPGHGPGYLWNPDDAIMLPTGDVVSADIKNCRILRLRPGSPAPVWTAGTVGVCRHDPPTYYGSPNGVFPLPDGNFLVTEINGDWVDEIDPAGRVLWSAHPPGVRYPSDSNQYAPGQYLTVDYSPIGQVVIFDRYGHEIWRWRYASGPNRLRYPSLAEALPNGDILVTDDHNDRVIVIDPKQNRIVWQYGHTGVPGSAPGYLNIPDGLDPLPPYAYLDRVLP
ncbi:hypothetical protein Acel_0233 [Acidothermus cellulolyticus 11B]|uniref:NHL repeat containing protein n=1 Tax=Acidothermus cellulolyticus (strain ATCC 43068 / DSM 8971 / 11B) TaxID=351607 RepID=A0LRE7_ACIC1|nr:hypothetical protein [Acidothermus cellulolyticus]ABK52007.1 hypothetical protein Acel_0233 [Acidothermus cellulolyticus 11B]